MGIRSEIRGTWTTDGALFLYERKTEGFKGNCYLGLAKTAAWSSQSSQVGEWLKFSENTVQIFKGMYTTSVTARYTIYLILEEYLRFKNKIGWLVFKF